MRQPSVARLGHRRRAYPIARLVRAHAHGVRAVGGAGRADRHAVRRGGGSRADGHAVAPGGRRSHHAVSVVVVVGVESRGGGVSCRIHGQASDELVRSLARVVVYPAAAT